MAIHLPNILMLLLAFAFGGSLAETQKELGTKETNQGMISKDRTVLINNVDPSQVIQLSWQPRSSNRRKQQAFLYRRFLSEEECDYLISQVHDKKSDTMQINPDNGLFLDTEDEISSRIEDKISVWTFLPKDYSKSLRVLRFGPEDSQKHYKYFDNHLTEEVREPLLATVILYLSNISQGGQIIFPDSENKMWSDCTKSSNILRPSKGNAILFFNQHLNATPDITSLHARCPVLEGELWFATKFFYLKGIISSEKDMLQSDNNDCTDEDENCPTWAAVGECQRNSVFMIGSPDYYGTCRKSCNAC